MDYKHKLELSARLINEIFEAVNASYDERIKIGIERFKDFPNQKGISTTMNLARYYQSANLRYKDIVFESPTKLQVYKEYPDEIMMIFRSPEFQYYLQWGINTDILSAILERL